MTKVERMLNKITRLINRDINLIAHTFADTQMDEKTALTVTRYADSLARISQMKEKSDQSAQRQLEKTNTDALVQAYLASKNKTQ